MPDPSLPLLGSLLEDWKSRFPKKGLIATEGLRKIQQHHPTLWAQQPIPDWALRSSWRLALMVEGGMGASMDPESRRSMLASARRSALDLNASPLIHELLKKAGAADFTQRDVFSYLAPSFRKACLHSLRVAYLEQPEAVVKTIATSPGLGALLAATCHDAGRHRDSLEMLELLTQWGANWDLPSIQAWAKSLGPEPRQRWERTRLHLEAHRLDAVIPTAAASSVSRPRF